MKIEITRPGVHDKDGKEIQVGAQINVTGDIIPAWLVNKGRVVAERPKRATAVTNPAKDAVQQKADEPSTKAD